MKKTVKQNTKTPFQFNFQLSKIKQKQINVYERYEKFMFILHNHL